LALEELELQMETLEQERERKRLEIEDIVARREQMIDEFKSARLERSKKRAETETAKKASRPDSD
jgi:hypothetical protein